LEFNVPFQHKYGYIRDEESSSMTGCKTCNWLRSYCYVPEKATFID